MNNYSIFKSAIFQKTAVNAKLKRNVIFVIPGNCRTFVDCFDSLYTQIISNLFGGDFNIYVYLYLKLQDPGPKGVENWNFSYNDVEYNWLLNKINEFQDKYPSIKIEYKILNSNEISDYDLIIQVRDRSLYTGYLSKRDLLVRSMHFHYNLEKCGEYILEKENALQSKFDFIVWTRPDLFFFNKCYTIEMYDNSRITAATGPNDYDKDLLAIIPRNHFDSFFFDRMKVYRENKDYVFTAQEHIYWHTIDYDVKDIGKYYIKRT